MKPFIIGGVEMELPLIVGAGACKYLPQVLKYMDPTAQVGAVTLGSITPKQSSGNEGTLFYPADLGAFLDGRFALNSFGMPNDGYEAVARELRRYSFCKPLIVSIAGDGVSDYVAGVEAFQDVDCVAAVKLNLGCPNKHEKRTVPIGHDFESLCQILEALAKAKLTKPIWIKLSRYVTREWINETERVCSRALDLSNVPTVSWAFIDRVAELIAQYSFIRAVVYGNTLPNAILRGADGIPVTTPNGGKAGLSGSMLKRNTLAFIRRERSVLKSLSLIASGGVVSGDDAAELLAEEADAVALTSVPFFADNDPRVFSSLIAGSDNLQYQLMGLEP